MKEFVAERSAGTEQEKLAEAGMEWIRANVLPGAESIVREAVEEERDLPCFVRHEDAGGLCPRTAVVRVYGLPFCGVHGAEVRAGALEEVYMEAREFFERYDNPYVGPVTPVALAVIRDMREKLVDAEIAAADDEAAIRRAYPVIPERVDEDTLDFDYNLTGFEGPVEWNQRARHMLHRLMRQAYEAGAPWVVETLELDREHVAAQLAFALADYDERVGPPRS